MGGAGKVTGIGTGGKTLATWPVGTWPAGRRQASTSACLADCHQTHPANPKPVTAKSQ
jgi:hypothetical protein